jgi:hypothetical protein
MIIFSAQKARDNLSRNSPPPKTLNFEISELCLGTYECVATTDYCRDSKEPNTPAILFAIDVSYPMIKEGVVQLICANIKSMLAELPRDPHCDKVTALSFLCSFVNNFAHCGQA